jgi:hypothetical protein
MPNCKHVYVSGKKKGEVCNRFSRKQNELCYQHKLVKMDKDMPKEAEIVKEIEKIETIKPTEAKPIEVKQEIKPRPCLNLKCVSSSSSDSSSFSISDDSSDSSDSSY